MSKVMTARSLYEWAKENECLDKPMAVVMEITNDGHALFAEPDLTEDDLVNAELYLCISMEKEAEMTY